MTIATIMPMDSGTKYRSAAEAGVGVGDGVAAGAFIMLKAVSVYDGQ